MNQLKGKIALITGANSGIGFETASALGKLNLEKIVLAGRSPDRVSKARKDLLSRGLKDVFDELIIDVSEVESSQKAVRVIEEKNLKIDYLILNAGASTGKLTKNSNGVEMTFASSLLGHHIFTLELLKRNLLNKNARIIIAGSEAARGDAPGMALPKLDRIANDQFGGDIGKTLSAFFQGEFNDQYGTFQIYALAKLYVAWWASVLAPKLPKGTTVNTISPGSVPATNFMRDQPWAVRNIMVPLMNMIGPLLGMAGPISNATDRYINALSFPADINGKFYASPVGKLVGNMQEQHTDLLVDEEKSLAVWNILTQFSGDIN